MRACRVAEPEQGVHEHLPEVLVHGVREQRRSQQEQQRCEHCGSAQERGQTGEQQRSDREIGASRRVQISIQE